MSISDHIWKQDNKPNEATLNVPMNRVKMWLLNLSSQNMHPLFQGNSNKHFHTQSPFLYGGSHIEKHSFS